MILTALAIIGKRRTATPVIRSGRNRSCTTSTSVLPTQAICRDNPIADFLTEGCDASLLRGVKFVGSELGHHIGDEIQRLVLCGRKRARGGEIGAKFSNMRKLGEGNVFEVKIARHEGFGVRGERGRKDGEEDGKLHDGQCSKVLLLWVVACGKDKNQALSIDSWVE